MTACVWLTVLRTYRTGIRDMEVANEFPHRQNRWRKKAMLRTVNAALSIRYTGWTPRCLCFALGIVLRAAFRLARRLTWYSLPSG